MNGFLIPANSKKSMLIFGIFNKFDLIIFGIGIGISLILLLSLPIEQSLFAVIAIMPGMVCTFLVLPIPNYHNVLTFIKNMIDFYSSRQKYSWKGWCVLDGTKEESKK